MENPVILAVDDKPDNLIALEALLTEFFPECRVVTAASAEEGLERAALDVPDVALLDVQMPGMDGIEMCRRLKAGGSTEHVPVILLTAHHAPAHLKVEGLEACADDFISTPIDNSELNARVKAMLRIKRAEDRLRAERDCLREDVAEWNQKLTTAENRYRAMFDHMTEGVAVYRPTEDAQDFIFVDFNRAGERIERISRENIIGKRLLEVFPGVKEFGLFDILQRVNRTGKPEHHPTCCYKDSRIEGWRENFVYKLPTGEVATIYTDKTEQKAMEAEREKLQAQFQQSQKMEAIGTLAGGIAHDFNNILYPIMGYTEMAIDQTPEEGQVRKYLNEVLASTRRATELVKQILSFSRSETSEQRPFKVQPIVKEAIKLLRSTIPSTVEIRHEIDDACGPLIGDPTEIHQIMLNLCINAHHAMETTGGEIRIRLTEMKVMPEHMVAKTGAAPGRYLLLSVGDTGPGIPSDILDQIFEPYFTTKPAGKGTGLGLSVVYRIVKNLGGEILVKAEPGRGTRFDLYLPTRRVQVREEPPQPVKDVRGGSERVLVVDDETPIVLMLERLLSRLGYDVVARTDSVEALRLFSEAPDRFDLVITDMSMPHIRGDRLARKLIAIRPDIPVIICTGHSELVDEEAAETIGIKAFIMKPIAGGRLDATIRFVLDGEA